MLPVPAEELPVESQENAPVASPSKTALVMSEKAVPLMFGPNITGKIVAVTGGGTISGAFVTSSDANRKISAGTNAANEGWVLNASYSSDLYGNSETVQPFSLRLLPCIKF